MEISDSSVSAGITIALVVVALACIFGAFHFARRRRLVDDTPTLTTLGVFIGMVELNGTAESDNPLVAYLSESPCVWYQWTVEEHWSRVVVTTTTDSEGKTTTSSHVETGWTKIASGGQQIPFFLRDGDGEILVRPEKAEIESIKTFSEKCSPVHLLYFNKGPAGAIADSTHERRFTENSIPLHAPIYLFGQARERDDVVAPEISHHSDCPMFIISTRTEKEVSRGFRIAFWVLIVLGLGGGLGAWYSGRSEAVGFNQWPEWIPVIVGYFALVVVGWIWMVYNSLVMLRQRVRQGWSLIDVQLKRRADLIPALVATVKGYAAHESQTQEVLALLRSQATSTPQGTAGENPEAVGKAVMALAESYPDLKANESFLSLQHQLAETEQRIALARGYFNEIVKFYNTRIEVQPDNILATSFGFKKADFLEAAGFERAVPKVELQQIDPWAPNDNAQGLDL
jgi:hypothetical protein